MAPVSSQQPAISGTQCTMQPRRHTGSQAVRQSGSKAVVSLGLGACISCLTTAKCGGAGTASWEQRGGSCCAARAGALLVAGGSKAVHQPPGLSYYFLGLQMAIKKRIEKPETATASGKGPVSPYGERGGGEVMHIYRSAGAALPKTKTQVPRRCSLAYCV